MESGKKFSFILYHNGTYFHPKRSFGTAADAARAYDSKAVAVGKAARYPNCLNFPGEWSAHQIQRVAKQCGRRKEAAVQRKNAAAEAQESTPSVLRARRYHDRVSRNKSLHNIARVSKKTNALSKICAFVKSFTAVINAEPLSLQEHLNGSGVQDANRHGDYDVDVPQHRAVSPTRCKSTLAHKARATERIRTFVRNFNESLDGDYSRRGLRGPPDSCATVVEANAEMARKLVAASWRWWVQWCIRKEWPRSGPASPPPRPPPQPPPQPALSLAEYFKAAFQQRERAEVVAKAQEGEDAEAAEHHVSSTACRDEGGKKGSSSANGCKRDEGGGTAQATDGDDGVCHSQSVREYSSAEDGVELMDDFSEHSDDGSDVEGPSPKRQRAV